MVPDFHDSSSPSSSSSSSSSSNSNSSSAETDDLPPPASSSRQPKRKAGRKKFQETRHPVYHGVRARNGGRWVSEMREPHKATRIWLGTYPTPEMAARAHDVAAIALRGKSAPLNFSDSVHVLPRATSATPACIRYAATRAAEMYRPSESSPTSSLPLPRQQQQPPSPSPPPPVFVDEEAIFNMHGLIEDMAVGLLLTPPGMRRGDDWDGGECHVDWKLWSD